MKQPLTAKGSTKDRRHSGGRNNGTDAELPALPWAPAHTLDALDLHDFITSVDTSSKMVFDPLLLGHREALFQISHDLAGRKMFVLQKIRPRFARALLLHSIQHRTDTTENHYTHQRDLYHASGS